MSEEVKYKNFSVFDVRYEFTNPRSPLESKEDKLSNAKDKEILKEARGKVTLHIKGSSIRLSGNFSAEIVEASSQ